MIKITKKQIDLYQIRNEDKRTWGNISVVFGETSAEIMINSDYGHFAYNWFATGNNPKSFLCKIEMCYAIGKLCDGRANIYEPDYEEMDRSIKKKIIEERRENSLTKEEAREAFDDMPEYVKEYRGSLDLIHNKIIEHKLFNKVFCDFENLPDDEKIKRVIVDFWEHIWKPFVEELKKEMQEEKKIVGIQQ